MLYAYDDESLDKPIQGRLILMDDCILRMEATFDNAGDAFMDGVICRSELIRPRYRYKNFRLYTGLIEANCVYNKRCPLNFEIMRRYNIHGGRRGGFPGMMGGNKQHRSSWHVRLRCCSSR